MDEARSDGAQTVLVWVEAWQSECTVAAIEVARCRDAPGAGGNPNAYSHVPGSATFAPVRLSADGTASVEGGPLFQGYLVALADVGQGPPRSSAQRSWNTQPTRPPAP